MRRLDVWLADAVVGELILKDNGNLQFRYAEGYAGPVVSQALPLQRDAHPHAPTRAVFGGLLPEDDARRVTARNLGLSEGNDFGLLEELGGDVAGALILLEPGDRPPSVATTKALTPEALDGLIAELPQRPLAADPADGIRMSLAGAQPKLPVIVHEDGGLALPTNSAAPTTHIIKPEPERFPGLVDNEAFCMALARACGLPAAMTTKGETVSGRPYLLVQRYDRDLTTEPIRRLHQEDTCQALGRSYTAKYQAEGGPSLREVTDLLRRATGLPALELPRLIDAVTLNWLIGNCDAHGKNLSLLYDRAAPTLAPLYDLVSTVVYPQLTRRLAMSIDGARTLDDVDARAWDRLADDIGYRAETLRQAQRRLVESAARQAMILVVSDHDNATARTVAERVVLLARAHG